MARVFNWVACTGVVLGPAVLGWLLWKTLSAPPVPLATVALDGIPAPVEADVRTFAVTVDGKPGGAYVITTAVKDGVETATVVAEVRIKTAFYTYAYELNSVETWKNGRLASVEAKSNDDGKKRTVTATAAERGLTVTVNGDTRQTTGDVLTATGVRIPAGNQSRDAVLFDPEDGVETAVRIEPLGACQVILNGQVIDGVRFKLTGQDVATEWWFDKNGHVIRQEMQSDGRKVVLELTGVR